MNSAALTAERFVPHPFSTVLGARLYGTGDLVRYLANGDLEFLGRVDEQVKLRGFRIELGEIESVLCEHTAVREAVVVVREDVAGQRELVGYVVGETVANSELRAYLKERLPDYMVPSWLVWLAELPLTPNGKLDRRALPAPERVSSELSEEIGNRSPIEEMVAGIWSELLHVSQLRAGDNFFELGGHSLLATQLILRLWTAFDIELPLRLLFESPTVAGQARAIEEALKGETRVTAPPLLPLEERSRLPLSFAQQRLWFLDQLEPGSTAYNMPTGLRLLGQLNVAALERSFTEVLRRHEVLRTRFESLAGAAVQVVMPAEAVHLPVVDLRAIAIEERESVVRQMAVEEGQRVFALSRGGLLRQTLLRLGAEEHVLLFTMHHIVSDGWSMEILTREVSALYAAYASGGESRLAELPLQYGDYAVWQREWLQGEVLEEQLGYWRKQLAGAPAVLELPADHARPAQPSHRGAHLRLQLSAALTGGLKQLSRQEGVTLFMTLLTGWQLLLARYSRQTDVVVGSPVANRTRSEVEGLIGFFVNTLVLRTKVDGEIRVRELLQRVREVCLGAYAHQEVPFEMLVEQLQPERNMSHTPLFQVMLNLLNISANAGINREPVNASHLRVESLAGAEGLAAKFDLTLNAQEHSEQLSLSLGYNAELFEVATISRMLHHVQNLVGSLIAEPEQRVSELPLM
ncbi:MAG TPA: condensation domain-containing protein, partial [Longimicrobiales bacterium]|nr:condensation domain-containing protein [Longimicrobiales bacterium]